MSPQNNVTDMNFSGNKATSVNKNFGLRFINEENLTKKNKFYN
jgi:hypothetical protein